MTDLTQRYCVACEAGMPPMTGEQAQQMLEQVPGWDLNGDKLERWFKFRGFRQAMDFVNKVADLAEAEGHHPNILVVWNRVQITLTTHAIKGLSENDFIMAAKISQI